MNRIRLMKKLTLAQRIWVIICSPFVAMYLGLALVVAAVLPKKTLVKLAWQAWWRENRTAIIIGACAILATAGAVVLYILK